MTIDLKRAGLAVPTGDFAAVEPQYASYRRLERNAATGAWYLVAPFKNRKLEECDWKDVVASFASDPVEEVCRTGDFDFTIEKGQPPLNPLSINLSRPQILVLHLHDSSALQFSAAGSGITVSESDAELTALSGKLVTSQGETRIVLTPELPGEGSASFEGCRIAFFAVKPPSSGAPFVVPFNLHVEQAGEIDGAPYSFPIVIDPDVRHPGGSMALSS
ncbi:hypothetical protein GRI38_11065 [Altererythrobacter aurantiacus]|uniref:Uncharacterized protein n=1 Tax=Parapontixanthobacter aurantiacus TaxID=1463599 RepID=A0A844ZG87_9SPHN|nr:nucleotide synthetase [Parapontixanthobacter aurantiacus]MXO86564.1 hypothetical protein [Parapontixanthobacter aurantiacus]